MSRTVTDLAILEQWQNIVEILAKVINVPTAIITHVKIPLIEVFKANTNLDSPYQEGLTVELANHYCEEVIKQKAPMHVVNARKEKRWKNAPELDHNMVSYLGYPLSWPDGEIFGTICVLDQKENSFSNEYKILIEQFQNLVEAHLTMIIQKNEIDRKNTKLEKALLEVKQLRGIIPICSQCKKIRNDSGFWEQVEKYVSEHSDARFSHGLCPDCMQTLYPDYYQEKYAGNKDANH